MRKADFVLPLLCLLVAAGCGTKHPTPEEAAENERLLATSRSLLALLEEKDSHYSSLVREGDYSLWPSPDPRATAFLAITKLRSDIKTLRTPLADFEAAVVSDNWNVTVAKRDSLRTTTLAVYDRNVPPAAQP